MSSLDLLLEIADRERSAQLAHFDALDAKAGILLGFAGALVALSPPLDVLLRLPAVLALVGSSVVAAAAFRPRRLPALDVGHLRTYLRAEPEFTQLTLFDTYLEMIRQGADELKKKARLIKLSVGLLALAAGIVAIGVIGGDHV